MKDSYYSRYILLIFFATVILTSCKKDDPFPASLAAYEINSDIELLERGVPIKFNNLSLNADSYEWDFGDGSSVDTNISPEHTFTESGTYLVSLTAFTQDGQKSTEAKEITIKKRVLLAFTISNINFLDDEGNTWDDDDTGPDLVYILSPSNNPTIDNSIWTDTVDNVSPTDFPVFWEFSNDDFELYNEDYDLILLDYDKEKEGTTEDPLQFMIGYTINPVLIDFNTYTTNNSNELIGIVQISDYGFVFELYCYMKLV